MNLYKGWWGEKKVTFHMWLWLPSKRYFKIHDLILPYKNGTAQIDHLIISEYGLFIVETKNRNGWIFGSENSPTWTQSLYGNNYTFQNPLRQMYRQKKVLADFLNIAESDIHCVVYFVGESSFRTSVPYNVISKGLGRYIRRFRNKVISLDEVRRYAHTIDTYKKQSSYKTEDHVKSLRFRHSSLTVCPKCGSPLIERTAKRGKNIGSTFLGCSSYPTCRFSKSL